MALAGRRSGCGRRGCSRDTSVCRGTTHARFGCEVEWKGSWFPATVIKKEKDRWHIHYVGYEKSWDEWVGKDRIKFLEKK